MRTAAARLLAVALVVAAGVTALGQSSPPRLAAPLPPLFPADNWWNQDVSEAPVDPESAALIAFINNGGTRRLHPDFGGNRRRRQDIYGIPVRRRRRQPAEAAGAVLLRRRERRRRRAVLSDPRRGHHPAVLDRRRPAGQPEARRRPPHADRRPGQQAPLRALRPALGRHASGRPARARSSTCRPTAAGRTAGRRPTRRAWPSCPASCATTRSTAPTRSRHAFGSPCAPPTRYVWPASHAPAATRRRRPSARGCGSRRRRTSRAFRRTMQKIFRAMKKHGLIVADNGSDMYVSGAFDPRWDNDMLNPAFRALNASDFEVIQLGWRGPTGPPRRAPCRPPRLTCGRRSTATPWRSGGRRRRVHSPAMSSTSARRPDSPTSARCRSPRRPPPSRRWRRPDATTCACGPGSSCGMGPASNELVLDVPSGCGVPTAPGPLVFSRVNRTVSLAWGAASSATTTCSRPGTAPEPSTP